MSHYLQENPHEIDRLFAELLIGVTGFFRDPQAFDVLAEKALPELLASRAEDHEFRVWVPGLRQRRGGLLRRHFAARVRGEAQAAVQRASFRHGSGLARDRGRPGRLLPGGHQRPTSPRSGCSATSASRSNAYHIRKEIRETLVFAPQNVIKDPPFTKLDLVVCRNLLIYLRRGIAAAAVAHFPLRVAAGRAVVSRAVGIDRRVRRILRGDRQQMEDLPPPGNAGRAAAIPELPAAGGVRRAAEGSAAGVLLPAKRSQTTSHVERMLLSRFAPTSMVVDDHGVIVYIHGRTGAYLEPGEGQPRNNVLEMARPGLARPLAAALHQVAKDGGEAIRENVRVKSNGGLPRHFSVTSHSTSPRRSAACCW